MATNPDLTPYRRIACIGAIASHDVGDDAVFSETLWRIERMFGDNQIVYALSRDASYLAMRHAPVNVVPIDYLHRIMEESHRVAASARETYADLLAYDPASGDNLAFAGLHEIFSTIDVLHIVAGGHLNMLDASLVEEVLAAVRLAQRYGVRVIATGLSVYPLSDATVPAIHEILAACDLVDFRDGSVDVLSAADADAEAYASKALTTIDDALWLHDDGPSTEMALMPSFVREAASGTYLNLSLRQSDMEGGDARAAMLMSWAQRLVDSGTVDHVNVLGLSSEHDLDAFGEWLGAGTGDPGSIRPVNLVGMPPRLARHVISHASYNVGTHYHQAVFSLAAGVPSLSFVADEYDIFKLGGLYDFFGTRGCHPIAECTVETLDALIARATEQRGELEASRGNIEARWHRKLMAVGKAYALDDAHAEALYQRMCAASPVKVSVIIPIFNMASYLRQCLDSVVSQSLSEIEVMCVNDGSTDESGAILLEYAWRDQRVKVITQENAGVSAARNAGLRRATGEFVFFVDPDDWLASPGVLAELYFAAKRNHALASCGTFIEMTAGGTGAPNTQWLNRLSGYEMHGEGMVSYRDFQFDFGWIRFMYQRDALLQHNAWFPKRVFFEDPVWFVRVMDAIGSFYATTVPTYCYRTGHKDSRLSYRHVVDLLRGVADNLSFAAEKGYDRLWTLTYDRLTKDFAHQVVPYLSSGKGGPELEEALARLDALTRERVGDGQVERAIFAGALENAHVQREAEIAGLAQAHEQQTQEALLRKEQEFRSSRTWMIGNVIWWVPKRVKDYLRARRQQATIGGNNG